VLRWLVFLGVWLLSPMAFAQPELTVLETPRFRIEHTARSEGSARFLASQLEQVRDEFRAVLGRDWPGMTRVRLGYDRAEMEALALGGKPPGWAVALAYPDENVILLSAHALGAPDGLTTLRHELSHVALGQLGQSWPRWFQEGLAMYLTGERFSLTQYSALFRAVTQNRVSHFKDLAVSWPSHPSDVESAYAQSLSFVAFLRDRHGPEGFARLLEAVETGAPFETAFARSFRTSLGLEEEAWRQELPSRYSWWPIVTGASTLWVLITLMVVAAYLRRRAQLQVSLKRMEAEEQQTFTEAELFPDDETLMRSAEGSATESTARDKPTLH